MINKEKKIKKRENKIKKKKEKRKIIEKNNICEKEKSTISIFNSLKENWRSWTVVLLSSCILSYPNIYNGIITIIFCYMWSYWLHRFQHEYDLNITNIIHQYHHDNHSFFSEFTEIIFEINFINNCLPILLFDSFMNQWVIILFTFMYITIHKINYSTLRVNSVHRLHHGEIHYNHGPDICDIMFGTKHPSETTVENTDHYIPNILIGFVILYGIQYLWNNNFNYKCYMKNIGYTILISSYLIFFVSSIYLWYFTDFTKKWNDNKKNTENTMI